MELNEIWQATEKIMEMLSSNGLLHFPVTYHGFKGVFIPTDNGTCHGIAVTKCNKDIYRVYSH